MSYNWTKQDIEDIFNSGGYWLHRGDPIDYEIVALALSRQWLRIEPINYTIVPEPEPRGRERLITYRKAFNDGAYSDYHGRLKWWAWNWLESLGETSPIYEYSTYYCRADLASESLKIFIECGDTSPGYMLKTLWSEWNWVIFPYHSKGVGYAFHPHGDDGARFLSVIREKERQAQRMVTTLLGAMV